MRVFKSKWMKYTYIASDIIAIQDLYSTPLIEAVLCL